MEIRYHAKFLKHYRQRIQRSVGLRQRLEDRVESFTKDPGDEGLQDHPLKGKKLGLRAFSVTGDVRIVYRWIGKNVVQFLDVGGHNQVY
ncbi:MAG: hypothetical protein A2784_05050 [Candidatus Chisholmbacteria bacterium RIFCSPHIGHO2_01_FULL_48_12]|uniref:Type II toxin-antitoxin system mRNA interferase toxin, RelE/StbE family n=1 Tax=Candidatus Chisholmbacteria bacterium RIFCSPHIGHO2_01_FULL_48_12 TaxID=1797589 RepID=A0A1G1VRQ8_9BACT|nr:MAG: hypothetical protein A2784_05050 [Candidatus Chisholmbacteria bacterium RIFCSPHIGHO2_01_FULL_48_12]